ncbi:MAG: PAS domain S-box protein [Deltaproteobacteria bacterium]|nr:PAS domain S-box protein [Deltaproteobacteria bacterium]
MIQSTTTSQSNLNILRKRLVTGVLFLNLIVGGIVWFSLQNSKTHHEEQVAVTTRNISRVLDGSISGVFEKVDIALQAVSDEAEHQLAGGVIQRETLNNFIIRQHSRLPDLLTLRATDASGDAVYGPETKVATTTSLAHRDYFKFIRDNPNSDIVISKPLVGGISGKWMIILARGIHRPEGAFAGLVYAGLGLEYLMQLFKELNVGTKGTLTLLDEDLSIVAHYPDPKPLGANIGQKFASSQLLDQIKSGKTSATYTTTSTLDGIERIFSYRILSHKSKFCIITGLSADDYLTGWRSEVYKISLFWAVFCISTVVSAWLFYREWNRTRMAEQEVLKSEQRFRLFIENANDLIYTLSPAGIITYVAPNVEFLLGYLPFELIGTSFDLLVHHDELQSCNKFLRQIMESGAKMGGPEFRIRHKDNNYLWFLSNASLVTDTSTADSVFLGIGRDITARKQVEEALQAAYAELETRVAERTAALTTANAALQVQIRQRRQAEEELQFRNILLSTQQEASLDGILVVDGDARIISHNNRFVEMWGIPTKLVEDRIDEPILQLVTSQMLDPHSFLHQVRYLYEHRQETSRDELLLADGRVIERYSAPMIGPEDRYYGRVWYFRDMTEHKRAENVLREREETYSSIINQAMDAIMLFDPTTGRFVEFNESAHKDLGYTRDEFALLSISDIQADHSKEEIERNIRCIREQERMAFETRHRRRNGEIRSVHVRTHHLLIRGKSYISVVWTDITEQKRAEAALRYVNDYHRSLIEASLDPLLVIGPGGKITDVNSAAELITGCSRTELIGTEFSSYFTEPDKARAGYEQVFIDGAVRELELKIRRRDGQCFFVLYNATTYRDQNGDVIGVFAAARDVTGRKRAEEEKEKLQAQLLQAQKMEAIGTLAGGIAHDFNNILSAILGYTQLALLGINEENETKYFLSQIHLAGRRATDLVKHILSFSRQTEQQRIYIQVSLLIKEALKLIRASIPTTIEIKQRFKDIDSVVFADPTSIHQIVMNLCTNAAHAMEEKGGILSVNLEKVTVAPDFLGGNSELSAGNYVKLSVSDTGSGIKPEIMDRIFDPYFTTKGPGKGTGLGLAVIHGIVHSLKGAITVDSEPGKGTTFSVYLPKAEHAELSGEYSTELLECGSERILFVDDEAPLADMGQRLLERLGYRVITKTSSLEALELFKAKPTDFDLVITDHTMPQMTGMELAKELLTVRPDIPIIICTGFSHQVSEKNVLDIGIKKFIRKPLLINTIAQAIREVLEQEDV